MIKNEPGYSVGQRVIVSTESSRFYGKHGIILNCACLGYDVKLDCDVTHPNKIVRLYGFELEEETKGN